LEAQLKAETRAQFLAREAQATSALYASGAGDIREAVIPVPNPSAQIGGYNTVPTLPEVTVTAPVVTAAEVATIETASGIAAMPASNGSAYNYTFNYSAAFGLGTYLGAQSATGALYTTVPAAGPYGQIAGTQSGYQAHHLNQNAVYKTSIAPSAGQSILLRGNAITDAGSPHYEAHGSLERWWNQYREGGPLFGQTPTNAQYGQAAQQSLLDAGLSPADAVRYAEVARQQRLANGQADAVEVSKIPRAISQPGGNVVDAELWNARNLSSKLSIAGKGLTAVGIATDSYSLYNQYQISAQTGNYTNTYQESIRIAGGWTGAWAVGTAGAEFGAGFGLVFGPMGAVVGGAIGGLAGGIAGYIGGSYASVGIARDLGVLPPNSSR
jgi:hypothetical protein